MMKKIYLMIGLFFWVNMSNPKYNDRHLSILTEEYFKTENLAPELIGHRFYMDENELLEDVKIDKEKELEKGKEYKNEIKTINVDININIEDFESDIENVPFCF